jgi:uncharacterized protein (TIGR03382 family)
VIHRILMPRGWSSDVPVTWASDGFDWIAAAIGAATTLGVLLLAAAALVVRRRTQRPPRIAVP